MTLLRSLLHVRETVDRRVLGAVRLVDAATGLPVGAGARLRVLGAVLARPAGDEVVPLGEGSVRIRPNAGGLHVLFRAPLFEAYTHAFEAPAAPPQTGAGPLRLRLAVEDAGPAYLPRAFTVDLPRALDPEAADAVFTPVDVPLLRAPGARVAPGAARLVVRVREAAAGARPLPGVLVRVFRSPRAPGAAPLASGMTEWRGRLRGEALVPVAGLRRFRPGGGDDVIETTVPVVFEAARHAAFGGAEGTFPDADALAAALPADPAGPPAAGVHVVRTDAPVALRPGAALTIDLAMP